MASAVGSFLTKHKKPLLIVLGITVFIIIVLAMAGVFSSTTPPGTTPPGDDGGGDDGGEGGGDDGGTTPPGTTPPGTTPPGTTPPDNKKKDEVAVKPNPPINLEVSLK